MPDERYSDENPPDRDRYSDENPPDRRYEDEERERRYDRDFRGGSEIPNYLVQSILVTLFCCWPFGIPAIINAAKVNSCVAQGNYREAQEASDAAKKWCTVSFTLGLIGGALIIGIQCLGIMAGGNR
jgi:hypothetical protein